MADIEVEKGDPIYALIEAGRKIAGVGSITIGTGLICKGAAEKNGWMIAGGVLLEALGIWLLS
jgi:hypothetical protein